MTARTSPQTPGTPTWLDFWSRDVDATRQFWADFLPYDIPPGSPEYGGYTVASSGGRYVFGIGPAATGATTGTPREADTALMYFASADVDADVDRMRTLGGTVVSEPADIEGTGRSAVCTDPTGIQFGLWQAGPVVGYGAVDEPGFPCWQDCMSTDVQASADFLAGLFGFTFEPMGSGVVLAKLGDDGHFTIGGCTDPDAEHGHWITYLLVADLDRVVERVTGLGAQVTMPLMELPFGRFAHLTTPGGAPFGLFVGTGDSAA